MRGIRGWVNVYREDGPRYREGGRGKMVPRGGTAGACASTMA